MIDYAKVKKGDILRLVGAGAPGYAQRGDLLRVTEVHANGVKVEDKRGAPCEFVYSCGAARLEPTEWTGDFPAPESGAPEQKRYPVSDELQRRIENAFTYHPPKADQATRYQAIRQEALLLAMCVVQFTPAGREQSLALTKLEEAVFFANAAIARGE